MKTENKILRTITFTLPSGNVKMGGELGAMLGQYNLNIMKFCSEFNELSKIYEPNLPIITHLHVLEGNTFKIELKGPAISFLVKIFEKNKVITLFEIYKIALLRKHTASDLSLDSIIKNIISSLLSSKTLIKYE